MSTGSRAASHADWHRLPACPVCDGTDFTHLFDKAGEPFVRCGGCGLVLINPRPPQRAIDARYDPDYSAGYTRKATKKLRRSRHRVARLAREFARGGRWLDVGCSAGFIVKAAEEAGFEAWGVDVEAGGIRYGQEVLGLGRLACGTLEAQAYPAAGFNVVTAYDVIEHVPDLNRFVAELARVLAPGGVVEIGTPDLGHWRVPRTLDQWPEIKPSEHLYYFDRHTLGRLLARHGLAVRKRRFALKPGLVVCATAA